MYHNSLASSTLHWKRLADQDAEDYLERILNHNSSGPDTRKQSQGWDRNHTSPEKSVNTTRKTQYDEGEEEAEEVAEETDTNRKAPRIAERQNSKEEENPRTEEGYETTIRKRAKINLSRTEKYRAPTQPEETLPTESPTTEGPTHSVQDKEESRDTIENMNITEILTHMSA